MAEYRANECSSGLVVPASDAVLKFVVTAFAERRRRAQYVGNARRPAVDGDELLSVRGSIDDLRR
jgi:hypothetical protein